MSRLHSTSARFWCQKHMPHLIRESILHHVGKEIDLPSSPQSSTLKVFDDLNAKTYRFIKFWSILFNSQQMHSIHLPNELDAKSRAVLLSYLGSGFKSQDDYVPTLGEYISKYSSASLFIDTVCEKQLLIYYMLTIKTIC